MTILNYMVTRTHVHLLVAFLLLLCSTPTLAEPPAATPASAKVQNILQRLLRGDSADELRKAVADAKLTAAEKQQIRAELSKPEYRAKIEVLKRSAVPSKPTRQVAQMPRQGKSVDQLRNTLTLERQQQVQILNRQATEVLQTAKSQAPLAMSRPPAQPTAPKPQEQAVAPAARPGVVAAKGVIRSVSPAQPMVSGGLAIQGGDFGVKGGIVRLLFRRGPSGQSVYPCGVNSWSNNAITVTVPTGIEELFHHYGGFNQGVEPATLMVIPRGMDLGIGRDVTVALNPEQIVPEINAPRPSQITPGSRVVLTGRNLSIVGTPIVTARFQDHDHSERMTVREYNRHLIEAELPGDVSGVRRAYVVFEVHNGLSGRQGMTAILFIPAEEIREHVWSLEVESSGGAGLDFLPDFLQCSDIDRSREISFETANGWRLESFSPQHPYEEGRWLERVGCYWSRTPTQSPIGDRSVDMRISGVGNAWAESCRAIRCEFNLSLRGPRGTYYGSSR